MACLWAAYTQRSKEANIKIGNKFKETKLDSGVKVIKAPKMVYTKNEQIMEDMGLPKAQRRILPLLMQGLSNDEIASALYLSSKGVKFQVTNLYKHTKLDSRARLMAGLAKVGWKFDAKVAEPRMVLAKVEGGLSVGISNGLFK